MPSAPGAGFVALGVTDLYPSLLCHGPIAVRRQVGSITREQIGERSHGVSLIPSIEPSFDDVMCPYRVSGRPVVDISAQYPVSRRLVADMTS